MPFSSVWEYLRDRTRDAVLAGFQDALDVVEGDDVNGSQHDQANRLLSRLRGTAAVAGEPLAIPNASTNGHSEATVPATPIEPKPKEAPPKLADASSFDDELQNRFNAAAAQKAPQAPPAAGKIGRKRRGRPPKQTSTQP